MSLLSIFSSFNGYTDIIAPLAHPEVLAYYFFIFLYLVTCRKSTVVSVQPLHTSWNKKQKAKMEQKLLKVYERELKDNAKKEKEVCLGD